VWKAKREEILRKINAARQALATVQPQSNYISETQHWLRRLGGDDVFAAERIGEARRRPQ